MLYTVPERPLFSMSGPKKPLFQPPVARGKPGWLQAFAKDLVKEDAGQLDLQVGGKLQLLRLISIVSRSFLKRTLEL